MKTTLKEIWDSNPCVGGWEKLVGGLGTKDLSTEVTILKIYEINGIMDAMWALRTQNYKDYCLMLADIAESVLYIFENKYPKDSRVRDCIQGIRDYKAGKISNEKLCNFSSNAANASNAAYADACAAYADACAAYAAAATAYAAYAAYDAYADSCAAYAAAATAKRKSKWKEITSIFLKHLKKGER